MIGRQTAPLASSRCVCDLAAGDAVQSTLSEAEVEKLRRDCLYTHPTTDRTLLLSAMAKTAVARQNWIRSGQPRNESGKCKQKLKLCH